MIKTIGTILLAIGFITLLVAWAITDPTSADANIGAGGLILLGRLAGSIGLILVILDVILSTRRKYLIARDHS